MARRPSVAPVARLIAAPAAAQASSKKDVTLVPKASAI
jgi:hypothetical protein